ncbi:MAG: hypothetical protein OEW15_05780 [Nitrospirota bacterium]|nr:hypothetical protein [Nitrospirota bacterium]
MPPKKKSNSTTPIDTVKHKDDNIKNLEEKKAYLKQWLDNIRSAGEIVPTVEHNLEVTEWELETLENVPSVGTNPDLKMQIEYDTRELQKQLPMMPKYKVLPFRMAYTSTASAATVYSELIQNINWGLIGQQDAALESLEKYDAIQTAHQREEDVLALLKKLNVEYVVGLFTKTKQYVYESKNNPQKITSAANEMRNLLLKFKGELFDKARANNQEKSMDWGKMSSRLSDGDAGIEQQLLIQEKAYSRLNVDLSNLLKERHQAMLIELHNAWVLLLDHIFVTIGLIYKE